MPNFDTSKWFKKQYLAEANITEEKLTYTPPDVFFAIYNILKSEVPEIQSEYGTASYFGMQMREKLDMYGPGDEILLGLKTPPGLPLELTLSQDDMDKLHNDGEIEIDGHKISYKAEENLNEGRLAALKQQIAVLNQKIKAADTQELAQLKQELAKLKKEAAVEFLRTKR